MFVDAATATAAASSTALGVPPPAGGGIDYYPLQHAHSTRKIFAQHMSAYVFAARQLAPGAARQALDAGSGQGYGTAFLADCGVRALGVDVLLDQLTTARASFVRPGLAFAGMNLLQLGLAGGTCDLVSSFQVIEHIPEDQQIVYLREIARVLAPSGVFCVSTLNRAVNMKSAKTYTPNPEHTHEFIWPELLALLRRAFRRVEPYSLLPTGRHRLMQALKRSGLCNALPPRLNPVVRFYERMGVADFVVRPGAHPRAIDLLCLCRVR